MARGALAKRINPFWSIVMSTKPFVIGSKGP